MRDREHAIAKEHLAAGRKDRALIALRRRKYQEGLLAKTDSQLENLEQLVCPYSRLDVLTPIQCTLGQHCRVLPGRSVGHAWFEAGQRRLEGDTQGDECR